MLSAITSSFFLAVASAAALPAEGLQPRQGGVITNCVNPGVMAITFDDGPWINQAAIVEKLNAAGAKATFFVNGDSWDCIYNQASTLQATYEAGHQIASHTWSHPNLEGLGPDEIMFEMIQLENALANILGVAPTYMRPPEGAAGGSVIPTVSGMGYQIVNWDVDTQDWDSTPVPESQQTIMEAGTSGNGHIILMHETVESTAYELVPWVLDYASSNGLQLVTVAECVGDFEGGYREAFGDGAATC